MSALRFWRLSGSIGFGLLCAIIATWALGPFVWQALTSVKPPADLTRLPPMLPRSIDFDSYVSIFREHYFGRYILNSLAVAGGTTILSLAVGSFAAYAIAKLRFGWKPVIMGLILMVAMFPPIATVSPLFLVIRALGLRDTWIALVITYTAFTLPLTVWILTSFFRTLPTELIEAAKVDGCTSFQAFRLIILPLAAPGVFTTAILVFIFAWNEFLFALTFTATPKAMTVPVGIAMFAGVHELPWGDVAAASVVVTVPLVVMALVFQRRIIAGLTAGSVKG